MTVDEANKINDMFKQIDTLTAENESLKTGPSTDAVSTRLDSIEAKLDKLLTKGGTK